MSNEERAKAERDQRERDNLEARIRERAAQLWVRAGRPEGHDTEFWLRAEHEIELEDRNSKHS